MPEKQKNFNAIDLVMVVKNIGFVDSAFFLKDILERIIESGQSGFYQTGKSLREVHDDRLYRELMFERECQRI